MLSPDSCHHEYSGTPAPVHSRNRPTATVPNTTPGLAKHERAALVDLLANFPVERLRDMVFIADGMIVVHAAAKLESFTMDAAATLCAIANGSDVPVPAEKPEPVTVGDTTIRRAAHVYVGSVRLTGRQKDILLMIARGVQTKQIARDLQISDGTVKVHLKGIFKALGVKNRTQAAVAAGQLGLEG
ncbi:LuxR C-terminal-related transcriptional regulator (plasmid) [Azospirillum sp. A26]|uniref:response regulator transcription factor n=1 Tax=Azospirillum sp. A26 TaxID=3160607 RepID=UPI00366FB0FF